MNTQSNPLALVADIGGTNARFALAFSDGTARPQLREVQQFAAAEHESLAAATRHYLRGLNVAAPQRAVLAVASAVHGDQIRFTNNPWSFSTSAFTKELGLKSATVINDLAAVSLSLPLLNADEIVCVGGNQMGNLAKAEFNCAAVGLGTGLGVCGLAQRSGVDHPIQGEGGHMSFSPFDDYEIDLLKVLSRSYSRVSTERLLSGAGLLNLYRAASELEGFTVECDQPAKILELARANPGGSADRVMDRFCAILGGFSGDIALCYGAWDGLFLAGGVSPLLLPWLQRGGYRQRFENKEPHRALMQSIATTVIVTPYPGLLGAAVRVMNDQ